MRTAALAAIIAANVLGGLSYPWQKMALAGLPPGTIILGRNLIAVVMMLVWLSFTKGVRWRYPRGDMARMAVIGLVAYGAPLLLGMYGTQWSTASNGSLLILLEPAAILVFARMLLGESIRPAQAWGVALGLAGGLFIVTETAPLGALAAAEHLRGNVVLAIHAVLWGLYSPVAKPLVARHSAMNVTLISMLFAMILFVPAAAIEWPGWEPGPELSTGLLYMLVLGVGPSFAATLLWVWSLRHLQASTVAPFVFLQPLAGVLAGALFLGEGLTPEAIAGSALISAGVLLVILRPGRR